MTVQEVPDDRVWSKAEVVVVSCTSGTAKFISFNLIDWLLKMVSPVMLAVFSCDLPAELNIFELDKRVLSLAMRQGLFTDWSLLNALIYSFVLLSFSSCTIRSYAAKYSLVPTCDLLTVLIWFSKKRTWFVMACFIGSFLKRGLVMKSSYKNSFSVMLGYAFMCLIISETWSNLRFYSTNNRCEDFFKSKITYL